MKLVQTPISATAGVVETSTSDEGAKRLRAPFAFIARIHHDSTEIQRFSIRVDGRTVCEPNVPAGTHRVDCVVREWNDVEHAIVIAGPTRQWTVEYLEIATHHGNVTGVLNGFVLPRESTRYVRPDPLLFVLIGLVLAVILLFPAAPAGSRVISLTFSILSALVLALFTAILMAPIVSPYRIVVSPWTLVGWACVLRAQVATWLWRPAQVANMCRVHHRRLAWTVSVTTAVCALAYGSRALGASDTYGYVSQAELWLDGHLRIDQAFARDMPWPQAAWTFSPFGYRPDPRDDRWMVPTYSPGLPMLLAAAKKIGGQGAMFSVVPMCAGLLVLATYGLGRRLQADVVGFAGACLVAVSPVALGHAMNAMSDVPVAAAWAGAFYVMLGRGIASALAAGLLSGAAIVIRPNLAPLAAVLGLHYVFKISNARARRSALGHLLAFAVAASPGPLAVASINQHLYGSPFFSGYGRLDELFAWSRVASNLRLYLGWLMEAHTAVVIVGLAAIFFPVRRLWPRTTDRKVFVVIGVFVAIVWLIYCAWLLFDTWWFSRFLLPTWPFMMLGVAAVAAAVFRLESLWWRRAVLIGLTILGVIQVRFADARGVFDIGRNEQRNVVIAQMHRQMTEPNSVTIAMIHSGSIRYYAGRMTLNWAHLDGSWLDRAVDWLRDHGVRTYVVIEDWELPEFRQRFAGARVVAALTAPPIAVFADPGKLMIFDLAAPPSPTAKPMIVTGTSSRERSAVPPVPLARPVFNERPSPELPLH
jgi:hypothetical protein